MTRKASDLVPSGQSGRGLRSTAITQRATAALAIAPVVLRQRWRPSMKLAYTALTSRNVNLRSASDVARYCGMNVTETKSALNALASLNVVTLVLGDVVRVAPIAELHKRSARKRISNSAMESRRMVALKLFRDGLSRSDIARALGVSQATVTHMRLDEIVGEHRPSVLIAQNGTTHHAL